MESLTGTGEYKHTFKKVTKARFTYFQSIAEVI